MMMSDETNVSTCCCIVRTRCLGTTARLLQSLPFPGHALLHNNTGVACWNWHVASVVAWIYIANL